MIIEPKTINIDYSINSPDMPEEVLYNTPYISATGEFQLYFERTSFVTPSAPTGGKVYVIPAIKAIGDVSSGHVYKLIDLNTNTIIKEIPIGQQLNGFKWIFRHMSGNLDFPYMPDTDWAIRAQLEYPTGVVYASRDVIITNGPAVLDPVAEAVPSTYPPNLNTGSLFDTIAYIKNIGDIVGVVGCNLYTSQIDIPNMLIIRLTDVLPIHPEFNISSFGSMGMSMPPYDNYIKVEGFAKKRTGWIKENTVISAITCNDPIDCSTHLNNTDCYNTMICCWDYDVCRRPGVDSYPYISRILETIFSSAPGNPFQPYDERFDVDEDGEISRTDIINTLIYANSRMPDTLKILYDCHPDIDLYSREIKNFYYGCSTPSIRMTIT